MLLLNDESIIVNSGVYNLGLTRQVAEFFGLINFERERNEDADDMTTVYRC